MVATARANGLNDYILVAGDVVQFDFLSDTLEPADLTISNAGKIQAPLIGSVTVAGLTLAEAEAALRQEYVDRKMLIDPKIDLTITNYRPIFVLGDIAQPGSFPYQPNLSVVQAVGLAGGPAMALSNEEDRLLKRATLRSEIEALRSDVAREAVWTARLNAMLAGRDKILPDDLPEETKPYLNSVFVNVLQDVENRVLSAEVEGFNSTSSTLLASIEGAEKELALLQEMTENQRRSIQLAEEEVDRGRQLQKKGLMPLSQVAALERQTASESGRLLQNLADVSQAVRALGELKREFAALESERRRTTLLELQDRQVAIHKLLAAHQSLNDQLTLVASWSASAADGPNDVDFSFTIRRRTADGMSEIDADEASLLSPGDVVIVRRETLPSEG